MLLNVNEAMSRKLDGIVHSGNCLMLRKHGTHSTLWKVWPRLLVLQHQGMAVHLSLQCCKHHGQSGDV